MNLLCSLCTEMANGFGQNIKGEIIHTCIFIVCPGLSYTGTMVNHTFNVNRGSERTWCLLKDEIMRQGKGTR